VRPAFFPLSFSSCDAGVVARAPGGRFVLHAKALPGNPYDGHTVAAVIEGTENLTGCEVERSNAPMLTRATAAMKPQTRAASSSPDGSAAFWALLSASYDADPPSKPSLAI
jgi:transposase, IS5 family